MVATRSIPSHLLVLALAVALGAHTIISFPLTLVGPVLGGTSLLVVVLKATQRFLTHHRHTRTAWSLVPIELFLLVFSTVSTIQVLIAQEFYGPRFAVDSTPGFRAVVVLVHLLLVADITWTKKNELATKGLCLATVYSSILYSPAFAAPEAVPPFVSLAALALVLLTTIPHTRLRLSRRLLYPVLTLITLSIVATLGSYAPNESWLWVRKLLALFVLAALVPLLADTAVRWNTLARTVILASLGIPVLLSATKLLDLWCQLGLRPAFSYKLMLNELGRANLIARTLVVSGPLLIAQTLVSDRRLPRIQRWFLLALTLGILVACHSWGAWLAVALTGAFVAIVRYGRQAAEWYQKCHSRSIRILVPIGLLAGAGLVAAVALVLAPRANIESFNGRLYHARIAFTEFVHNPLLGVGPGQHYSQAQYAGEIDWQVGTQAILNNPLRTVDLIRLYATMHTHNLFIEIAAGTGLLGLASFVWFLVELLRSGLTYRASLSGPTRTLVTGCLAGLVASVGWGLLDVMEISPPLLTAPTWALIGLSLAAPQAFGAVHELGKKAHSYDGPRHKPDTARSAEW